MQSVKTIRSEISMIVFWEKLKSAVKKYWQLFLGLGAGLLLAASVWWNAREQKRVLKNALDSNNDIKKAEQDFDTKVDQVIEDANEDHSDRVVAIDADLKTKNDEIKKDYEDRVEDNNKVDNEELARRLAARFGAYAVNIKKDNDA